MADWDFFLAHTGADADVAKRLYDTLEPCSRVFLDSQRLSLGDNWPQRIALAQRNSLITIVLVSPNTENAYYQREEIAAALNMARRDEDKHRIIPVYLNRTPDDNFDKPYGLESLHGVFVPNVNNVSEITRNLLYTLRQFKRASWEQYDVLDFEGYKVPYIPLINDCRKSITALSWGDIDIKFDSQKYVLPEEFIATKLNSRFQNNPGCRLSAYELGETELSIRLSETNYEDYLKSGEHLDDPLPNDRTKTFRDAFGILLREDGRNLRPFNLTNICGAGVFIISEDDYIVIATHSERSHVYPGRMTFSASGILGWGAYPHPFSEIMRKCYDETCHQINLSKLQLIGFGVDARKLYFQFSFYEKTALNLTGILRRCPGDTKYVVEPFHLRALVDRLINGCWEPAAEAALLTMCVDRFGREKVSKALLSYKPIWGKRNMRDEWDYRASRAYLLPDMSVRYPQDQLAQESKRYVDAVLRFISDDVNDKDVIEIGCGTGRITERLAKRARSVTCVDLCERMILRNKERLGSKAKHISYINNFAQEYDPQRQFDIAICSLVLIHNVNDSDFQELIGMMCKYASVIYVFEDVTKSRGTSPHTQLRTESELKAAFASHSYQEDQRKHKQFQLFDDKIVFLRFCRQ